MTERLIAKTKQGDMVFELYEPEDSNLEVFVDGVQGLMASGSTVKLNCFTRCFNSTPDVERRKVACRLVMGVDTFLSMADFLKAHADKFRAQAGKGVAASPKRGARKPEGKPR